MEEVSLYSDPLTKVVVAKDLSINYLEVVEYFDLNSDSFLVGVV